MVKYLFYFFILSSVFLLSGFCSEPNNQQEYNRFNAPYLSQDTGSEHDVLQTDTDSHEKHIYLIINRIWNFY